MRLPYFLLYFNLFYMYLRLRYVVKNIKGKYVFMGQFAMQTRKLRRKRSRISSPPVHYWIKDCTACIWKFPDISYELPIENKLQTHHQRKWRGKTSTLRLGKDQLMHIEGLIQSQMTRFVKDKSLSHTITAATFCPKLFIIVLDPKVWINTFLIRHLPSRNCLCWQTGINKMTSIADWWVLCLNWNDQNAIAERL